MKRVNDLIRRQQGRRNTSLSPGFASFGQVVEHVSVLLPQSDDHSQNSFNKPTAVFTLGSKTASAPDHAPTQRPLGSIVSRFHSFLIHESPQCRFHVENILAGSAGVHVFHKGADIQQGTDFLADRLHGDLKIRSGQGSIAYSMPPSEHLFELSQQQASDDFGLASPLHQSLKVAFEMRPADLSLEGIQPVIGTVAIRADNPVIVFAQQLFRSSCAAVRKKAKHGYGGSGAHPQPEVLRPLLPAGLIQVHYRLPLNVLLGFFDRLFHGLANYLLLGGNASQADLNVAIVACNRSPKLPLGISAGHSAVFCIPQAQQVRVCS
jgi:hypothetical protein